MESKQLSQLVFPVALALLLVAAACGDTSDSADSDDDVSDDDNDDDHDVIDDDDNDDNDDDNNDNDNDDNDNDDNDNDYNNDIVIIDSGWTLVDGGTPGHNGTSLVRDSAGNFYLAAVKGQSLIVYTRQNQKISRELIATPASGPMMKVDDTASLHILYLDPTVQTLYYANNASKSWVVEAIPDTDTVEGAYSLGLDSNGKAHISYYYSATQKVTYATNQSGFWQKTEVASGGNSSIALDSNDAVHIAHAVSIAGYIQYVTNASGSWVSEPAVPGDEPVLALDSANQPHIVYHGGDYGWKTFYAFRDSGKGSWNTQEILDDVKASYIQYDMTLDLNDKAHVSYTSFSEYAGNGYFIYATNQPGSWQLEFVGIPYYIFNRRYSSITLDDSNQPYISSAGFFLGNLTVAGKASKGWRQSVIDAAGYIYKDIVLAVDETEHAFIGYRKVKMESTSFKVAGNSSGSWVKSVIENSDSGSGERKDIAVDSIGYVHLAYGDNPNNELDYANNSTGPWISETIVPFSSSTLRTVTLALDAQGYAHLSYALTHGGLGYTTNRSGSWVIQTVADGDYYDSQIALDNEGYVHIVFLDEHDENFYATNRSGDWVLGTFESDDSVAGAFSLLLDASGNAHLAYVIDGDPSSLKYATNETGAWETTTIASDSNTVSTAMALDAEENVSIAYYAYDTTSCGFFLAENDSGDWTTQQLAGCDFIDDGDVDLKIDQAGQVHATFSLDGGLYYRTISSAC